MPADFVDLVILVDVVDLVGLIDLIDLINFANSVDHFNLVDLIELVDLGDLVTSSPCLFWGKGARLSLQEKAAARKTPQRSPNWVFVLYKCPKSIFE